MKHIRQKIIDELTANPGRSLVDIARIIGLSVADTHSILQQMIAAGDIVVHSVARYYLKPRWAKQ